ncbi:hypothetical protein G6F51_014362 [Rhizopus arrhizus]|uniref:Uncharacterized protein n=1 Tax=Rhizopus oryzae TaxID=64495 RepID=A0A9P6XMM9_RHIOR|nr:hypothetical protein G6F51_014362 [Rhizopus arrhizus]
MTDVVTPAPDATAAAESASVADVAAVAAADATVSPLLGEDDDQTTSMAPAGPEVLVQVYGPDGKPLLEAATTAQLAELQISAFSPGKSANRRPS